mgnify:CR=1 FL=1
MKKLLTIIGVWLAALTLGFGYLYFDKEDMLGFGSMPVPIGENYFENNAVNTIITTQSTLTKVVVTTTLNATSSFDSPSPGRLRYTGLITTYFHCGATASLKSLGTNTVTRQVLVKNGTINANNEYTGGIQQSGQMEHKVGTAGDVISSAIHSMVRMATNDYVELAVSNDTDTNDFTITNANTFCLGGDIPL